MYVYKLKANRLTHLRISLPIIRFVNLLVAATSVKTLLNYSTFMALFVIFTATGLSFETLINLFDANNCS